MLPRAEIPPLAALHEDRASQALPFRVVSPLYEDHSRASSADRAEALTALSRSYSKGTLNFEEYQARIKRANDADTRGQLYAVVRDLQLEANLARVATTTSTGNRISVGALVFTFIAIIVVTALIVAGLMAYYGS